MPQYIPSQFVAGMNIGSQLVNNAMDQSARAISDEAKQAYAQVEYQNKLQDSLAREADLLAMRINPVTGAPLEAWQRAEPGTYGSEINRRIYEGYLERANVRPGKGQLEALVPGAQAWIPPTAVFPGVPSYAPGKFPYVMAPGVYNQATLPNLRSGATIPFVPNPTQATRGE